MELLLLLLFLLLLFLLPVFLLLVFLLLVLKLIDILRFCEEVKQLPHGLNLELIFLIAHPGLYIQLSLFFVELKCMLLHPLLPKNLQLHVI